LGRLLASPPAYPGEIRGLENYYKALLRTIPENLIVARRQLKYGMRVNLFVPECPPPVPRIKMDTFSSRYYFTLPLPKKGLPKKLEVKK
jgi:hypothetical protein